MTMEESILKTAALYNKVLGNKQERAAYDRLIGKIGMYKDVTGKEVTFTTNANGNICSVIFGEDERVVEG